MSSFCADPVLHDETKLRQELDASLSMEPPEPSGFTDFRVKMYYRDRGGYTVDYICDFEDQVTRERTKYPIVKNMAIEIHFAENISDKELVTITDNFQIKINRDLGGKNVCLSIHLILCKIRGKEYQVENNTMTVPLPIEYFNKDYLLPHFDPIYSITLRRINERWDISNVFVSGEIAHEDKMSSFASHLRFYRHYFVAKTFYKHYVEINRFTLVGLIIELCSDIVQIEITTFSPPTLHLFTTDDLIPFEHLGQEYWFLPIDNEAKTPFELLEHIPDYSELQRKQYFKQCYIKVTTLDNSPQVCHCISLV